MKLRIGQREFEFTQQPGAPNRFNIHEVTGGKKAYAGEGNLVFYGDALALQHIKLTGPYRGKLGAGLLKTTFRFLAKAFPEKKTLSYTALIEGKPIRHKAIKLERFRKPRRPRI